MVSAIDSFRETFGERFSFLKFAVFAVPVYYSYQIYIHSRNDYTSFWGIAILTAYFLFGFVIKIVNNVINERNQVLPSLNPMWLAFSASKGLIAVGPCILICSLLANSIASSIHIIEWLDITLKVLIWLIAASIMGITFLMFAEKERITAVFNFKKVYTKVGDFMISIIFLIVQIISINIFTTVFVGYTMFVLLGYGPILEFYITVALVFNLAVISNCLGQCHYEIIGYED